MSSKATGWSRSTIWPRCSEFRCADGARRPADEGAIENRAGPTTLLPRRKLDSTLRLPLEFYVADRDGCGFTPACSSHDLDRAVDGAGIGKRPSTSLIQHYPISLGFAANSKQASH